MSTMSVSSEKTCIRFQTVVRLTHFYPLVSRGFYPRATRSMVLLCVRSQQGVALFFRSSQLYDSKLLPKGSQNGAQIIKNEVLEAPCFKGGSQEASRAPPGSILERFWDHFGTIFTSFSDTCLAFLHAFFSSMLQTKTFKITRSR